MPVRAGPIFVSNRGLDPATRLHHDLGHICADGIVEVQILVLQESMLINGLGFNEKEVLYIVHLNNSPKIEVSFWYGGKSDALSGEIARAFSVSLSLCESVCVCSKNSEQQALLLATFRLLALQTNVIRAKVSL